jgi:hypothetical protein
MNVFNSLRINKFKSLIQKIFKPEKIQKIQLKHKLLVKNLKLFKWKNKLMKKRIENLKILMDQTFLVLKMIWMIISK